MSHRVDLTRVRGLVAARLGRSPQDELEAAVVLEAWGGVAGDRAMSLGRMAASGSAGAVTTTTRRARGTASPDPSVLSEGVALVIAVLAVAAWAAPMGDAIGPGQWERALTLALPVSFAIQWGMRARFLSREGWRLLLRREAYVWLTVAALTITLLMQAGRAGLVAALLIALWTLGSLLVRAGGARWYAGSLAVTAVALDAGAAPIPLLAGLAIAALAVVGAVLFLASGTAAEAGRPGAWRDALAASLAGGGLGLMLVADETVGWGVHGSLPALMLIPSTIGSFWGAYRLWRLPLALTRSIQRLPSRRADGRALRAEPIAVVGGAVARLAGATFVLSLVVLYAGRWTSGASDPSLLVGFGCVALGSMAVSLLWSVGQSGRALMVVAAALAVQFAFDATQQGGPAGQGLIIGGIVCSLLALPPVLIIVGRPGRALATKVWIK